MKINKVLCTEVLTGFYMDDKEAIKRGAEEDGFIYKGDPVTPGFKHVRQPGVAVSVMFVLENGDIAYGDCAVAQYAASDGYEFPGVGRLPASIRYGVTQDILEGVSKIKHCTMCEVVLEEYNLPIDLTPVRLNAQSGDDRYLNVDKMILKKVGMMPHGLINNVEKKLGAGDGKIFLNWIDWVTHRIKEIGEPDYNPVMRYDMYGTIGYCFDNDLGKVLEYLLKMEDICKPYQVFCEMPVDLKSDAKQMEGFKYLKAKLKEKGSTMKLIIDEYANTYEDIKRWVDNEAMDMVQVKTIDLGGINNIIEAVLYCKEHNILAYQGGTCNETDHSAIVCVNLAVATKPFAMASKPGMGVDEGVMIVNNEQQRLLKILEAKQSGKI